MRKCCCSILSQLLIWFFFLLANNFEIDLREKVYFMTRRLDTIKHSGFQVHYYVHKTSLLLWGFTAFPAVHTGAQLMQTGRRWNKQILIKEVLESVNEELNVLFDWKQLNHNSVSGGRIKFPLINSFN